MQRYDIIVSVEAKDQGSAFAFVETAIEHRLAHAQAHAQRSGINTEDGAIRVSTPDGTKSTVL